MSSCRSALAVAALAGMLHLWPAAAAAQQPPWHDVGRAPTPAEIAAWDIDVRPDFKGLPPGRGSVAQGMAVWEDKCASCHGVFGESNEVFQPIVGGTTRADIAAGRVASLISSAGSQGRTTLMKLPTLSTLWDYIRRAMPWNAPKSLTVDETYAVTAYILHLGGIVDDAFVLSEANVREVQQRLPNRQGMTREHAMWPGRAAPPDVRASACMNDCLRGEPTIASRIPDYARNAHGNLADQQRLVGAMRGAVTAAPAAAAAVAATNPQPVQALLKQHNCLTCHGLENKVVGPALREVATRHAGRGDAAQYFEQRISAGSSGQWGNIPMPGQSLPAADARTIAAWLAGGAKSP